MRMTVEQVMTTNVVAVNENAPFHEVAELLIERGVSGLPVVDGDNRVLGVVSEADLLHKEEFKERYYREGYRPPLRSRLRHRLEGDRDGERKATGRTAGDLMTSPAIVTTPDAPVVLATRTMERHGVKRLPVVDAAGKLAGIVTRRDIIRVFVRKDEDIERQIRDDVIVRTLWADPAAVTIGVADGVVTLSGTMDKRSEVLAAVRLAQNLDGVVAVLDELSWKEDDTVPEPTVWGGA